MGKGTPDWLMKGRDKLQYIFAVLALQGDVPTVGADLS